MRMMSASTEQMAMAALPWAVRLLVGGEVSAGVADDAVDVDDDVNVEDETPSVVV